MVSMMANGRRGFDRIGSVRVRVTPSTWVKEDILDGDTVFKA
jgi:hypothetical protein